MQQDAELLLTADAIFSLIETTSSSWLLQRWQTLALI
jgi:hypothetical protein